MPRSCRALQGIGLALALSSSAVQAQQPGETWERIALLPGRVSAVAPSPAYQNDGVVYVGLEGGGLWRGRRTVPFGKVVFEWTQTTAIPSDATVTAIALHPAYQFNTGRSMFVGIGDGWVHSSTTDFSSVAYSQRMTTGNGIPAAITDLAVRTSGSTTELFIASRGGGIDSSTDLLATPPTEIGGSSRKDATALSFVSSSGLLYVAHYTETGTGRVERWDGSTWVDRGSFAGMRPTDLVVSSTGHAHLGSSDRGMRRTADITAGTPSWYLSCDGSSSSVSYRVNALALCPQYALDREVFEGRSDGAFVSFDWAQASSCSPEPYHGPVTAVAFAPAYHSSTATSCERFEGTEDGLYVSSCRGAAISATDQPGAVPAILDTAISGNARGAWAGSDAGLLRYVSGTEIVAYNAFYGDVPDVAAVAVAPDYSAAYSCSPSRNTLFMADRDAGVHRSTDKGNSWTLLSSGWPTPSPRVADIVVSPRYATDGTVFAATDQGLFKWTGNAWDTISSNSVTGVTEVAVPLTYDNSWVAFASNGASAGLYISSSAGNSPAKYGDADVAQDDITAIAFSPNFNNPSNELLFVGRDGAGVMFTSSAKSGAAASFCQLNGGLSGSAFDVRDLAAATELVGGDVRLVAATAAGAYVLSLDPTSSSNGCPPLPDVWSACSMPAGDPDSTSIAFGKLTSGIEAILGTAHMGILFSDDHGTTFDIAGTGYRSLPSDTWATVPHPYSDAILFASSPSSGVFVSTTGGSTFWPWNQATSFCMDGAKGLGVVGSRGCGDPSIDTIWAGAAGAFTSNQGIDYRSIRWDPGTRRYDFAYGVWRDTNATASTGIFEQIETLDQGPSSDVWASSSTRGLFHTSDCAGTSWVQDNPSGVTTSTSVRFGNDRIPATRLRSGDSPQGVLQLGQWRYYQIAVPPDTLSANLLLTPFAGNPDLYVRYGALPTLVDWDARSTSPTAVDQACLRPPTSGSLFIGLYGAAANSSYKLEVRLDDACTTLSSGAPVSESVSYHGWSYSKVSTLASDTQLKLELAPSTGDPDIYVIRGELPTLNRWTYRPYIGGLTTETVCIPSPGASTWYVGVHGYAASTYTITATRNPSPACTPSAFTDPGARIEPPTGAEALPRDGDGSTSGRVIANSISWATVDMQGVHRLESGTWQQRNGSGWGTLANLATRSVIQTTPGDVYCGSDGNIFVSRYPDEGSSTWTDISYWVAGSPSWDITDFLEASNGDVLISMNGTYGSGGGVWLTANDGKAWMQLNQGFDAATQSIKDLVDDSGAEAPVQYYASTDGSGLYTRTITPAANPTLTSLVPASGSSAGGEVVTVNGGGFASSCITGNADDCPFAAPVVWFGGTPAEATWVSGNQLSVTTPAHGAGTVDVVVMNPDTRESNVASFTYSGGTGGAPTLWLLDAGDTVRLVWSPAGTVTVERSTTPDFQARESATVNGMTFLDPDDVLLDTVTYYYRVTSQ